MLDKNAVISQLIEGAYKLACKKERSREVAKEWAHEAILKACIEYDRYSHLPENELVLVLGRVCANRIFQLQRIEVEKDKRCISYSEEFETKPMDKVLDDGHYEPYVHHVNEKPEDPHFYEADPLEGIEEFTISRELMAILLLKCNDRHTKRFIQEKLNPSEHTRRLMEEEGYSHPLDKHIFPDMSKATISRVKSRVRELVNKHGY